MSAGAPSRAQRCDDDLKDAADPVADRHARQDARALLHRFAELAVLDDSVIAPRDLDEDVVGGGGPALLVLLTRRLSRTR